MSHVHEPANYNKAFALGVGLNLAYVALEAGFGSWADSLALLADAGHNLSDVLGLLLAWGAHHLSRARSSPRRTYGWRSTTILAALLNSLLLLVAVGAIAWEAVRRLQTPAAPAGDMMMLVAALGVVINTATALLFLRGRQHDVNLHAAFLHMAADAGVSLGVVVAGLGVRLTGWAWLDPAASLLISAVILAGTWGLLRESLNLMLHSVPRAIDLTAVREYLESLPGVVRVHDLHVWAMSTTQTALTAHLVKPEVADDDPLLALTGRELHERFGIDHATLQIERSPDHCRHESCAAC